MWFAPEGMTPIGTTPQVLRISDRVGMQGGVNSWGGLADAMGEINATLFTDLRAANHYCDGCLKDMVVDDDIHSVSAASVDGICKTAGFKCLFHGCRLPLPDQGGSR